MNARLGARPDTSAKKLSGEPDFEYHLRPSDGTSQIYLEKWNSIVRDFPAHFFRECDRVALDTYVHVAIMLDTINRLIVNEPPLLPNVKTGKLEPHPLLALQTQYSKTVATLAPKLRVCPSARVQATQVKDSDRDAQDRDARPTRGRPPGSGRVGALRLA